MAGCVDRLCFRKAIGKARRQSATEGRDRVTRACGPGSPILCCFGPTGCGRLTGIAHGVLVCLASTPSSPRIPRPGAVNRLWAGALFSPYPVAAPPRSAPRWGGAETYRLLSVLFTFLPFILDFCGRVIQKCLRSSSSSSIIIKAWLLECRQQVPVFYLGLRCKCETCGQWLRALASQHLDSILLSLLLR